VVPFDLTEGVIGMEWVFIGAIALLFYAAYRIDSGKGIRIGKYEINKKD
jgi:hypothetical protein